MTIRGALLDDNAHPFGVGVPDRIGDSLLGDPEKGDLDGRWDPFAIHAHRLELNDLRAAVGSTSSRYCRRAAPGWPEMVEAGGTQVGGQPVEIVLHRRRRYDGAH